MREREKEQEKTQDLSLLSSSSLPWACEALLCQLWEPSFCMKELEINTHTLSHK